MAISQVVEVMFGFGHENVLAAHKSTVEFTRDTHLTQNGDCVVVVGASKGLANLNTRFKSALRKPNSRLTVKIEVDDVSEEIHARGSPELMLSDPKELVLRKSSYVSNRTLGIYADKAACDLSRTLVEKLRNPKQRVKITLIVQA
jgi:uncharacterized protein